MSDLLAGCSQASLKNGLCWLNEPPEWKLSKAQAKPPGVAANSNELWIRPSAPSDFFRPIDGPANDNCCLLYKQVSGDFTAHTSVCAKLCDFGDAAAITVRASSTLWAKLCVERSNTGEFALVTVITNPFSDDANSELLPAEQQGGDGPVECWLQVTRHGNSFGMRYSLDGCRWRLVRSFGLPNIPSSVAVGIHAQAPFTSGCEAYFRCFVLSDAPIRELRAGL